MSGQRVREARVLLRKSLHLAWIAVLAAVVLATLTALAAILASPTAPASVLTNTLAPPWVQHYQSERLPPTSTQNPADETLDLTVRISPSTTETRGISGYRQFDVQATLRFGNTDNQTFQLIRNGLESTDLFSLMYGIGAPTLSVNSDWGEPRITIEGQAAKVEFNGVGSEPIDQDITIQIPDAPCRIVTSRQVVVGTGDLTPQDLTVEPRADQSVAGCTKGSWNEQKPGFVTYQGLDAASITLVEPPETNQPQPVLDVSTGVAQGMQTLWIGFLSALPLIVGWWLLKHRLWTMSTTRRTGRSLEALAAFILVINAAWALTSIGSDLRAVLNENTDDNYLINVPYYIVPVLTVALTAVLWRSLSLRLVLSTQMNAPRRAAIITFAVAVLTGLPLLVLTTFPDYFLRIDPSSEPDLPADLVRSESGLFVSLLLFAVATYTAAFLIALWFRAVPKTASMFALLTTGAIIVGLAVLIGELADEALWRAIDLGYGTLSYSSIWYAFSTGAGIRSLVVSLTIVVALIAVSVASLPWSGSSPMRLRRPRAWITILILAFIAGLAAMVLLLTDIPALMHFDDYRQQSSQSLLSWLDSPYGAAILVAVTSTLLFAAIIGLTVALGAHRSAILSSIAAGTTTILLLLIAPLASDNGLLKVVLQTAIALCAGVAVWTALDRMVRHVLNSSPPSWWSRLRQSRLRGWRGVRYVMAVALSIPFVVYGDSAPFDFYSTLSLSQSISGALPLLGALLILIVMRNFGVADTEGRHSVGNVAQIRIAAGLCAIATLFSPTATTIGLPIAFALGIFLVFFWLIPRPADRSTHPAVGNEESTRVGHGLAALAKAVVRARTTEALSRDLRKAIGNNDPTPEVQQERISHAVELAGAPNSVTMDQVDALSSYLGLAPWSRAIELALLSTIIGLPWSLLDAATIVSTISTGGPYRLVDSAGALLVVGRFTFAGFLMGLAYPLVRGRSGVGKGFALFLTMAGPALVITLLPSPTNGDALIAAGLQVLQWLIFGVVLGLVADWQAFRRFGYGWRHVRELHHMNAVTASLSTLAIAVITASAVALGTGAAAAFLERVLPPASSPSASQDGTSTDSSSSGG